MKKARSYDSRIPSLVYIQRSRYLFKGTACRLAPAARRSLTLAPTALAALETKPVGAPRHSLRQVSAPLLLPASGFI